MFRPPYSFNGYRLVMVSIDKATPAQSGTGAPSTAWTNVYSKVPAAIENVSGLERYADQALQGVSTYQVLIRYLKGVSERNMRVTFTNDGTQVLLDIVNVDNSALANRWLLLHCKSGVSRG